MTGFRLLDLIKNQSPFDTKGDLKFLAQNDEITSIINYVNKILASREQTCLIADDFGMPDFMSIVYESVDNAVLKISKAIENTINKYEPRLKMVKVTFVAQNDQDLSLVFSVSAQIINISSDIINFKTIFNTDGSTFIERS